MTDSEEVSYALDEKIGGDLDEIESSSDSTDSCEDTEVDEEYQECTEIAQEWGVHLYDQCQWSNEKRPFKRLRHFKRLILTDYEMEGVLSDRIIACFSSYFDKSPDVQHYAFCKCDLSKLEFLTDISILKYYHYLQYLDLSNNKLTDLSALSELPFLMYLNASHNLIGDLLNFKAPFNLTYADFSYNNICSLRNISDFWSLKKLILSNNRIRKITGVKYLRYLRLLDLSHNKIMQIKNLERMRLSELYLQNNRISFFEKDPELGLKSLDFIRIINLSNNRLTSLQLLAGLENVEVIDVSNNNIAYLLELSNLENLRYLVKLKLTGNPIANMKHYFSLLMHFLPYLHVLDDEQLTPAIKECANETTNRELRVSVKRANLVILQSLHQAEITSYVLPYDQMTRPILILVGLPGSGVKNIARQICWKMRIVERGVSHTTRPKSKYDVENVDYYFITKEEFVSKLSHGEFLAVSRSHQGYMYGTAKSELEKGIDKVLMFYMDFDAAIMLRVKGFSPKLIFCLPRSEETHLEWMRNKYYYYYNEKDNDIHIEYSPEAVEEAKIRRKEMRHEEAVKDVQSVIFNVIEDALDRSEYGPKYKPRPKPKEEVEQNIQESEDSPRSTVEDIFNYYSNVNFDINFQKSTHAFLDTLKVLSVAKPITWPVKDDSKERIDKKIKIKSNPSLENKDARAKSSGGLTRSASESVEDREFGSISETVFSNNVILSALSEYFKVGFDEAKHKLCDQLETKVMQFFNKIMKEREELLEIHCANIGLFHELIFTDDEVNSLKKIHSFLKRIVKPQEQHIQSDQFKDDKAHNNMLKAKLDNMQHDILLELSTADKQKSNCTSTGKVMLSTSGHSKYCLMKHNLLNNNSTM